MIDRPLNTLDCWFVTADEMKDAASGIRFSPVYIPYAYFLVQRRMDENTIEGFIGRNDMRDDFHDQIISTYGYFNEYLGGHKVYVTLDKTVFYEIIEIMPTKPLSFMLKKIKHKIDGAIEIRSLIYSTVHRLPFHLLGGELFEHLVFAYLQETGSWKKIEWLGETGKDKGRDIWAIVDHGSHCFQCANYQQLTFTKAKSDIDTLVNESIIPDNLTVFCGGKVTDGLRQKTIAYGNKAGIISVSVCSGSEFEETLRSRTPGLIQRFFRGVPFPDSGTPISPSHPEAPLDALPELEVLLSPQLSFKGTDEELGVCLAEAFYELEKGNRPAIKINILEETQIREQIGLLLALPKTVESRNKLLMIKKILDYLDRIKKELTEKIRLLYLADLYPLKSDFASLATSLRQILKLSFAGKQLYDDTDLATLIEWHEDRKRPLKYNGKWKIMGTQSSNFGVGFTIWLNEEEFGELKAKMPESISPLDMWFYGLECSDLNFTILAEKVFPAFIDQIYDLRERGVIAYSDDNSWIYLPSYRLGIG